MPSRIEDALLALALAWGSVLWDWLHCAPGPSMEAIIHHLWISVERTTWSMLMGLLFGLLAVTRFIWCLLWEPVRK
jgi:hypothetical protein